MKLKQLSETLGLLIETLKTHESTLKDEKFMASPAGTLLKSFVKSHYLYREILQNDKLKKYFLRVLRSKLDSGSFKKIMENLDIDY